MRVQKYIPAKLYGFCEDSDSGRQVFFHLRMFELGPTLDLDRCLMCPRDGCTWLQYPPPPILGEEVDVLVDWELAKPGQAPRAQRVHRLHTPQALSGKVEIFDPHRGFGFVMGEDGESYHLHKSEILDNRLPLPGQLVMFYAGIRQGRPRACHVKVCGSHP